MARNRDAGKSMNNRGPADRAAEKEKENQRQGRAAKDAEERTADDKVEEASEESFPASDPPGYTSGHS